MKILADENIPLVRDAFAQLGEVITVSAHDIARQALEGVECLLVRSVTPVGREMLEGTPVRFVATSTIGFDHIDTAYLAEKGIGFSSAPGSNANSVSEYVMTAIACYAAKNNISLRGKSIGVIGVGNVGSRVVQKAKALGLELIPCDPPLAEATCSEEFRPFEEALDADFVTFHTPLTRDGRYPTYHLCNARNLEMIRAGAVLINTSRGAVVETNALKQALRSGRLSAAILDVWEGEPRVDTELLSMAFLATPHIAGHSYDGKVNGTRIIYEAACRFFGQEPNRTIETGYGITPIDDKLRGKPFAERLWGIFRQAYDITNDNAAMRRMIDLPAEERGSYFTRLRKEYPVRLEFEHYELPSDLGEKIMTCARGMGFHFRKAEDFGGLQPLEKYLEMEDLGTPIDWAELFGKDAPVEVEIGCGNGRFLRRAAAENPNHLFLGIERSLEYVRLARDRMMKYRIGNCRIVRADATELFAEKVADGSIDTLHVYFTDPWPKRRHGKRRIFQIPFIETVHRKLRPEGMLHIKVDLFWYFEEILARFDQSPFFEVISCGEESDRRRDRSEITGFEQKALEVKGVVYYINVRNRKEET